MLVASLLRDSYVLIFSYSLLDTPRITTGISATCAHLRPRLSVYHPPDDEHSMIYLFVLRF